MFDLFRRRRFDDAAVRARLRALAPEPALRFESHRALDGPGPCVVAEGACPRLTVAAARTRSADALAYAASLETGDPDFDRRYEVLGPPAIVHAILDPAARAAIVELASRSGVVALAVVAGEVQVFLRPAAAYPVLVETIAADAIALAARLATPGDAPARLARSALGAARPEERARLLHVLARHHPDHDATLAALRAACADPSAEVRLLAGQALGAEGRAVLAALAAADDTADTVAAHAVDALRGALPATDPVPLLSRGPLLARACVTSLARGVAEGLVGHDAAESAIAVALARPEPAVRAAAIEALATAGGASAVALLEDAAARAGGDLRREARSAIAAIQSRLVGAGHGQVSLADGVSGQLSVARDTGDLSLADRAAGPDGGVTGAPARSSGS